MTIEDLPDPSEEGISLSRRHQFFISGSEDSITHSVSAAPMPSEYGKIIYRRRELCRAVFKILNE